LTDAPSACRGEPEDRETLSDDVPLLARPRFGEVIEGGDLPTRRALLQSLVEEIPVASRAETYPSFSLPAVRPPQESLVSPAIERPELDSNQRPIP
jgi:hypothetical protein